MKYDNLLGSVVKQIDYDSFGNIITETNAALKIPFGFAGGLHDRDTGLVRFGFRNYDADTGRWTAKDPLFFDGGDTDLYGYVLNNPVNYFDPFGLYRHSSIPVNRPLISDLHLWERIKNGLVAEGSGAAAGWGGKVAMHGAHHTFGILGKTPHIQFDWWQKGVIGSGKAFRIPWPW